MGTNAIAIFVKTPGLSQLKTRLAKYIGEEKALEFYRLSVAAIEATVKRSGIKAYWAVAEREGLDDPMWKEFERIWTGSEELGEAQHRVYSALKANHSHVAMIGADCPQMNTYQVQNAFALLQDSPYMVGPAKDGGYYLFAGKGPLPVKFWESIEYSKENTRAQLVSTLPGACFLLHEMTDVDHKADLKDMINEMPAIPSPEQKKLITFAHGVLSTS